MRDIKKEFENSFKGYHKDAPAHLKKETEDLKNQKAGFPWGLKVNKKPSIDKKEYKGISKALKNAMKD